MLSFTGGIQLTGIERALISVSDKDGLVDFARGLQEMGVEIVSTGGTAALLDKNGIRTVEVSDLTGFPEMLDGRVKTLHPKVHAGILARRDVEDHMRQIAEMDIKRIDMVVINLYPFKETVARGADLEDVIENIDIGGPSMIRAAAKNYGSVAVVTDPAQYSPILEELRASGGLGMETLSKLMLDAFHATAHYDAMIAEQLGKRLGEELFPPTYPIPLEKVMDLRYGENPDQRAAFYKDTFASGACVSNAETLHGKQLSFNNILDLEKAMEIVADFDRPTAVVMKHTNPCGIASADSIEEAFTVAYEVDPLSAYGCVIALNRDCDIATAEEIAKHFVEAVIAPDFDEDALERLSRKKNLRLLRTGVPIDRSARPPLKMKKVHGGMLIQTNEYEDLDPSKLKVVTKRAPTEDEVKAMLFAWKLVRHVWSNSIVYTKEERAVGIGAGQMSRVDSAMIARIKAGENATGAVMASDAFFPFRDGVDEAAKAGITAIIQPGGSIRDQEVIDAANEHGMAMVFSGVRVFRH